MKERLPYPTRKSGLGVNGGSVLPSGSHGALGASVTALYAVDDVASNLDVVVGKLANLGIINAHNLILLGSTQAESGDHVHNEQDNAGSEERVGKTGEGVGKLVAQLNVVVVDPAAGDLGGAIEVRNVVAAKYVSL